MFWRRVVPRYGLGHVERRHVERDAGRARDLRRFYWIRRRRLLLDGGAPPARDGLAGLRHARDFVVGSWDPLVEGRHMVEAA